MGKKNLDPKKLQRETEAIAEAAARRSEEFATKATNLAEQGLDWAGPRAQKLWDETVKVTAPKIEEAADKVRPYLDNVHDKVVDDYLPRIEVAAREAQKAASADGSLVERATRAGEVTRKSLAKPAPKKHRLGRALGWTVLGTAAAGAGYLLWRRSQPIEDPWAEEYWADLDTDVDVPDTPAEAIDDVRDAVADTAKDVKDKAEDVAENVEDKVEDVVDEVKDDDK